MSSLSATKSNTALSTHEALQRKKNRFRTLSLIFGVATLLALGAALAQLYWNHKRGMQLDAVLLAQENRVSDIQKRIAAQTEQLRALERRILEQLRAQTSND